jgi:hypothetical protein
MRAAALSVCLALILAGCSSYAWEKRRGIDPVLDPSAVVAASNSHVLIMTAFARDANLFPSTPGNWYPIAEAGFNYIDDECRLYFNHLFFLNREREQLKTGIIATSAATAAILSVTGATITSMAVVAQAFGLGATATDLIAGTYLYRLPPATTQGFVREMQLAFREGAALRAAEIDTPTAAYHAIQNYLALCLPPTIEARITERIATTVAIPDPPIRRGGASFGITLTGPPPLTRPEVRTMVRRSSVIEGVRLPLPDTRPKPPRPPPDDSSRPPRACPDGGPSNFERTLTTAQIREVQLALCVNPTGELGPKDSASRKALATYLIARGQTGSQCIDQRNYAFLDEAIEKVGIRQNGTCQSAGFPDAAAVGRSFRQSGGSRFEQSLTPAAVREIQIAVCVSPTGDLGPGDSATRKAIAAYLAARGKPASQTIDQRNFAFLDEAIEKVRVRQSGTCRSAGFTDAAAVGRSFGLLSPQNFEQLLTPADIREIQLAVCVSPTGNLGPGDSPTRKAIAAYFAARGKPASQTIDQRNFAFLDEAIEKVRVRQNGTCRSAGFADSAAVGHSFSR